MSIDIETPMMMFLLTENQALKLKCNELCESLDAYKTNFVLMSNFISSIYDFSGNIPSFAYFVNISTYDEDCNIISCVTSDSNGVFTPCSDLSNHIIPCVLPPDLSGNSRNWSPDCSMNNESRGIYGLDDPYYNYYRRPYCGSYRYPYYPYGYDDDYWRERPYSSYNLLLGNDNWRDIELEKKQHGNEGRPEIIHSSSPPKHMSIHPSSKNIELPLFEKIRDGVAKHSFTEHATDKENESGYDNNHSNWRPPHWRPPHWNPPHWKPPHWRPPHWRPPHWRPPY